jgi:hypothetical protein
MSHEQNDLVVIERLVQRSVDDVAVSLARSFERLEERLDVIDRRIFSRLAELENALEMNPNDHD